MPPQRLVRRTRPDGRWRGRPASAAGRRADGDRTGRDRRRHWPGPAEAAAVARARNASRRATSARAAHGEPAAQPVALARPVAVHGGRARPAPARPGRRPADAQSVQALPISRARPGPARTRLLSTPAPSRQRLAAVASRNSSVRWRTASPSQRSNASSAHADDGAAQDRRDVRGHFAQQPRPPPVAARSRSRGRFRACAWPLRTWWRRRTGSSDRPWRGPRPASVACFYHAGGRGGDRPHNHGDVSLRHGRRVHQLRAGGPAVRRPARARAGGRRAERVVGPRDPAGQGLRRADLGRAGPGQGRGGDLVAGLDQIGLGRDEAHEGLERGVLVPVLAGVGEPPIGYRSIHAVDLTGWDGAAHPGFADLELAIDALRTGQPVPDRAEPEPEPVQPIRRKWPTMRWLALALLALVARRRGRGAAAVARAMAGQSRPAAGSEWRPIPPRHRSATALNAPRW